MQEIWVGLGKSAKLMRLPPASSHALPGIPWGSPEFVDTPAYWAVRCRWDLEALPDFHSAETSLAEEIGFCLLGGFGVTYELGNAAYRRLRDAGTFNLRTPVSLEAIRSMLLEPLVVGGRRGRYRFPNQRATRLDAMRTRVLENPVPTSSSRAMREALMCFEGIGPKTTSWIVRNHLGSDDVAIIDIHVVRACTRMRLFDRAFVLPRDYREMERRFLSLAEAIDVRASVLDAVMWTEMRA